MAGNSVVAMNFMRMTAVGSANNLSALEVFNEAQQNGWIRKVKDGYTVDQG